ncbi:hypothetical protein D4Z93_09275 [Clostridium fermenticellae]|uniref:Flagellar protein FliT n=1 Tax=Clostridium fermenticellae TaxID=2068654 RepID=A0A386H4W7_9CLOT|nr:hypothetical protein [Clostridium fermenticellae]AYD40710.1 hypothetical protein D4Z93_09275 [Clostridium fermenticellae]
MDKELEDILIQYKICTGDIIELIENKKIDSVEDKIKCRQVLVNKIISMTDKKEEVRNIYNRLNIEKIEYKADKLIKDELHMIRTKLNDVSRNKTAANAYSRLGNSPKIFSKKI